MNSNLMEWTFVDSVDAKGNSSTTLAYKLEDAEAEIEGRTFYRVRMVDEDGQDAYSEEIVHERVSTTSSNNNAGTFFETSENETLEFALLQNPVHEVLQKKGRYLTNRLALFPSERMYMPFARSLTSRLLRPACKSCSATTAPAMLRMRTARGVVTSITAIS